jgi:hypothetical protein
MDLDAYRGAVAEARALQVWRSGKPAPMTALENPVLRRRVLTKALETRVVRRETSRRGLTPDLDVLNGLLMQAAQGQPPNLARAKSSASSVRAEELEAKLFGRYSELGPHIRRAALDIIDAGMLADQLLGQTPEAVFKAAWKAQNTTVMVDLVRIPRVPSSREIDVAVRQRQPAMKRYHETESKFFRKPARVFLRRMWLPWPKDATNEQKEALRTQINALRKQVESGTDFITLVQKHGALQDRRSGGKLTLKQKTRPDFYDLPADTLTPVEKNHMGLAFYRIEGKAPAVNRSFTDARVQREIAAALLRKADVLPEARRIAGEVTRLLRTDPDGEELVQLVKKHRLRRKNTPSFAQAQQRQVPTIGLAPALFTEIFSLTAKKPVSSTIHVRQDYVVARLLERKNADENAWPATREDYTARWKKRKRPRMVDEWLNAHLAGKPLWVDMKQVGAIAIDQLEEKKSDGTTPAQP